MNLIPQVKQYEKSGQVLANYAFSYTFEGCEARVSRAYNEITPAGATVIPVTVVAGAVDSESYTISIAADGIRVFAAGQAGAFYAAQTLRQLVSDGEIPCGVIVDEPDFAVRGFYHDMTRGRVASLATLKKLVDLMAATKMNMLQLYVEHVFEFKEYDGIYQQYGYMTAEETKELDAYCKERFVRLVPSLSCFGHLFELLQSEKYKDLCELENHQMERIAWGERMSHHTIHALDDRSFEVIKSLIDQYLPCFTDELFNICCDETFDLGNGRNAGNDKGRLYVDFVCKIVRYLTEKGKKVMMWGDVILNHSDLFPEMPEGILYGNWAYDADPTERYAEIFSSYGVAQIMCPGTNSWSRLIEDIDVGEKNIAKMASYAKKYNGVGVLNTNWGDYGNACGLWGALHGLLVGASKSWSEADPIDEAFDLAAAHRFYGCDTAVDTVRQFSRLHNLSRWYAYTGLYSNEVFRNKSCRMWECENAEELESAFYEMTTLYEKTAKEAWANTEAKDELVASMKLAAVCLATRYVLVGGKKVLLTRKEALALYECFREEWLKQSDKSEIYVFDGIVSHLSGKYFD
ncbi:MAG: family 20 glycosylhydrolase [Clostridia bacterium]|nr:family 20 glycosylhydrolase [Clostridia bacterium]